MDFQNLLIQYGYLMLILGLFIEGQTVLILAGFLAYLGYFNYYYVLLISFPSLFLGDVAFYQLAFHWGQKRLAKKGKVLFLTKERIVKWEKFINSYGGSIVYFSKLIWGLGRNLFIILGLTGKPLRDVYKFDLAACFTSVIVFVSLGYFLGHSYIALEKTLEGFGLIIVCLVLLIITLEKVGLRKYFYNLIFKKNNNAKP